jgi:hypothetical protein
VARAGATTSSGGRKWPRDLVFRFRVGLGRYPSFFVLMRNQYGIANGIYDNGKRTSDLTST